MKVIAVYHNKGGVGKTTTVVHLAATLAKKGYRVLIIDLDSQANSTYATGLVKFIDEDSDNLRDNNVADVLCSKNYPITDAIRVGTYNTPAVSVLPAHINIMARERELVDIPSSQKRLNTKLKEVAELYDFVLIDTPPSLNIFARIALITADYLLIPSDLKPFANQGLNNVREFIQQIDEEREYLPDKQPLKVLGVIPSKVSTNPKYLEFSFVKRRQVVIDKFRFPVLESKICERDVLAKALDQEATVGNLDIPDPRSIFDYVPKNNGEADAIQKATDEFNSLANEVIFMTNG